MQTVACFCNSEPVLFGVFIYNESLETKWQGKLLFSRYISLRFNTGLLFKEGIFSEGANIPLQSLTSPRRNIFQEIVATKRYYTIVCSGMLTTVFCVSWQKKLSSKLVEISKEKLCR